jgi:hypothetical protein
MNKQLERNYIAYAGTTRIAAGPLRQVAGAAKAATDGSHSSPVLIFDAETSEQIDFDFRGSLEEVIARLRDVSPEQTDEVQSEYQEPGQRSPGRPKLGVIAREVTLLPRHWDWLASQPGGASVTLRKLVEHARRSSGDADRVRLARESTYRFMSAMAGNEAGFEEATRSLFAGNQERFDAMTRSWPPDVREHAKELAEVAFSAGPTSS